LNAWHKSRHNNQVPAGWVADPDVGSLLDNGSLPDVFWPFNVTWIMHSLMAMDAADGPGLPLVIACWW
jgi:hypothetical protein